jgi:glucose/sorbosone dehydrogenase
MNRHCRGFATSTLTRRFGRREARSQKPEARIGGFHSGFWLLASGFLLFSVALQAQPRVSLETTVAGLSTPVYFTSAKDGTNRRFVVEQVGRIRVLQPGSSTFTTFLDVSSRVLFNGERGLLGLAFHPQFFSNGRFFVDYTRQPDGATVIAEFRVSGANPNIADPTQTVLLTIPQPYENHNGGMIEFGPDGQLYIGMGDGGSANDPENRAQSLQSLLGKILRLDVNNAGSAPTIHAYGFRNPWRFSFDRLTGQLWAGDVGQDAREEVDIVTAGGNYGWRVWEGTRCTNLGPASCSTPGFIPPVFDYQNTGMSGRCSIIGGYIYRGTQASVPYGAYVFGDLCSGEIFMLKDGMQTVLLDTNFQISSFGEDEAGEIYVVNIGGSVLHLTNPDKIIASSRAFSVGQSPFVTVTAGSAAALSAGYARVQTASGSPLPAGLAIFGFRSRSGLVSEASVPISPLISSGRIFAEVASGINTGIAIANPNSSAVSISFYFTDRNGTNFGQGTFSIPANQQIAAFLNEAPFNGGNPLFGTFTFSSSALVSAIALRGLNNERSEFLMTTLPVAPLGGTNTGPLTLPHFADGAGWRSQVVLTNPIDSTIVGVVQFFGTEGQVFRTEPFVISPRSAARIQTDGIASAVQTGSVRVSTVSGASAPVATSIFTYRSNSVTVTEAGAAVLPDSTSFQVYAELSPTIRTGLALANPSGSALTVTIALAGRLFSVEVPANGQRSLFLNEIPAFTTLPLPFQGVMTLSAPAPFAVTGIRGRTNERGEFLITTTAPVNPSTPANSSELVFPHFADGGGYSTQFILFGAPASGTMYFFEQSGQPRALLFQ